MTIRKRKQPVLDSILLLVCSLFLQCCRHPSIQIENEIFTIWYPGTVQVVDYPESTYRGYQIISDRDTLAYNIGFVVSNLSEDLPNVTYVPDFKNFLPDTGISAQDALFTNRRDYDIDRYRKQSVSFERSGSQIRKYTFPTDTNAGGWIGLYIDSVAWGPDGVVQFNAFVERPSKGTYLTVLKALKTINLKPPKADSFYVRSRYVP